MEQNLENKEKELTKDDLVTFIQEEFYTEEGSASELLEALSYYVIDQEELFDEAADIENLNGVQVEIRTDDIPEMLKELNAVQIGILKVYGRL